MKKYILIGILGFGVITTTLIFADVAPAPTIEPAPVQTAYIDTPQSYEIKDQATAPNAGEIKTTLSKTEPKMTLSKWNGEATLTITSDVQASAQIDGEKIRWVDGTKEFQAFPLAKGENMEDGGFQTQLILHAKPQSPLVEFILSSDENFTWEYQAPMNERGITDWHNVPVTCTEIACSDSKGNVMTYTFVDMAGGYTLMYGKQNHSVDKNGNSLGTNYQTGIFAQLKRPEFIDGQGKHTWGIQKYSLHKLQITIPDSVYNDPQTDWSNFIIK